MKRLLILIFCLTTIPILSFSQKTAEMTRMSAIHDFTTKTREGKASNRLPYTPFHIEDNLNALACDDQNFPFHIASAEGLFPGKPGIYTVCLNTITERDGECIYNVYVNDKRIGQFTKNPPTNEFTAPATLKWYGVEIPANAKIRVESNSYSNLKRHEDNFFEWARGRWTGIDFKLEQNPGTTAKPDPQGLFEQAVNIGSADIQPKMNYHESEQAFYLIAGGAGIVEHQDCFGFIYRSVSGNFTLEAGVKIIGLTDKNISAAGLMIRKSSAADAAFIACLVHKDGFVSMIYRAVAGDATKEINFKAAEAEMIQLEKKGDSFTISAAKFGENYEKQTVKLPGFSGSLMTGFCLYSGSKTEKEVANFSKVRFFEDLSLTASQK